MNPLPGLYYDFNCGKPCTDKKAWLPCWIIRVTDRFTYWADAKTGEIMHHEHVYARIDVKKLKK